MIPKQTPVRNFRPAAPPQTSLFSSLPLAPPRKSASSSSLIRPLCVQSQTLYRNHLRRQVRPRIACCITLPTSSSVPPFPQDLSQEKSFRASRPSSPNLPLPENRTRRKCLVSQSFAAARPLPHRLSSRAFRQNPRKKREARFGASLRSVSGGIRTRDLQSRSLTRYPAALQTQSTLLLYSVLCRRARLSFSPADCAYAPQVSRIYPRRRAVPRPLSPGSRGRCEGAVPLPCGL